MTAADDLRLGPLALLQERFGRDRRQRPGKEEPLRLAAAKPHQLGHLRFRFDAFRDHMGAQRLRERDDAFHDGGLRTAVRQAGDERLIDLERVHGKAVEMAQRRKPGAEVVEIDLDAESPTAARSTISAPSGISPSGWFP